MRRVHVYMYLAHESAASCDHDERLPTKPVLVSFPLHFAAWLSMFCPCRLNPRFTGTCTYSLALFTSVSLVSQGGDCALVAPLCRRDQHPWRRACVCCTACSTALCRRSVDRWHMSVNPFASEKIRTDSRIREIQALTPFN